MVSALTITYALAALALAVGVGVVFRIVSWGKEIDHDGYFVSLFVIPGFASLMYVLMALDVGTVTLGSEQILVPRYVDWLITTPVLVGYVAHVAGAPRKWIGVIGGTDAFMILLGMVATMVAPPLKWVFFTLSALCHLGLFAVLYLVLPQYVATHAERYGLCKLLQNHVGLLWVAYPVVWLVAQSGLGFVDPLGIGMTVAYLDVVAKVPYVYFVWNNRAVFSFTSGAIDERTADQEVIPS